MVIFYFFKVPMCLCVVCVCVCVCFGGAGGLVDSTKLKKAVSFLSLVCVCVF